MIIFVSGRPADPHLRAAVATKIARQKESAIEAATAKALEVSVCVCVCFVYCIGETKKTSVTAFSTHLMHYSKTYIFYKP